MTDKEKYIKQVVDWFDIDGKWHHIEITFDLSIEETVIIYIDGIKQKRTSSSTTK